MGPLDNCRRRKIRCLPPQDDSQGRCSNCFRLRIECNFHKLEAGRHRKSKPGVLGSQGSSAASSPFSGLIGFGPLSFGESPHDYTASAPVTPTYGATGISSDRFPSHSVFNANANGQIPLSHSSNVSSKPYLHLPGVGQGHPIPYDEFNWTPGPNENMIHSQNRLWQLFAGLHQHPDAMTSFTSLDSTDLQTASTSMSSSPITPMDDSVSCFQENICDTAGNSSDWMYGSMFPQS